LEANGKKQQFPLYGLDLLEKYKNAKVLLVSGEKCADAANALFTRNGHDWIAVTWHGGDGRVDMIDFSPLEGYYVVCWPDNDAGGIKAMEIAAAKIGKARVLSPPKGKEVVKGWDIYDALNPAGAHEKWGYDRVAAYLEGYVIPYPWRASKGGGIERHDPGDSKSDARWEPVCQTFMVVTRRLIFDGETERIEIKYHDSEYPKNGGWRKTIRNRAKVLETRTVVEQLGGDGISVASDNKRMVIRYLRQFIDANKVPVEILTTRMGWLDNRPGRFFPYVGCDEIGFQSNSHISRLLDALRPAGELEVWKEKTGHLKDSSLGFRTVMAASFASPLLALTGERGFTLFLLGKAGTGKSASLRGGASPWGDFERIKTTYEATTAAIQSRCSTLHHLPFFIDERQLNDDRHRPINILLYGLAEGKGKARADISGEEQETKLWNNIILANGEEPIITDTTPPGAQRRTLELRLNCFGTAAEAKSVHRFYKKNYGTAGPVFIEKLNAHLANGSINEDYARIETALAGMAAAESNLEHVSMLCLGDYYSSMLVWGQDGSGALNDAIEFGKKLLGHLNENSAGNLGERCREYLESWIYMNRNYFSDNDIGMVYGFFENGKCYMLVGAMEKALKEAPGEAFKKGMVLSALFDDGFLNYRYSKGKKYPTHQKWKTYTELGESGYAVRKERSNAKVYELNMSAKEDDGESAGEMQQGGKHDW